MRVRCAIVGIVASLAAACGHPPPPHVAEPDDEPHGATGMVWDDQFQLFSAAGTIDARRGDVVDWFTFPLFKDGRAAFEVVVSAQGTTRRLPVVVEVIDADGRTVRAVRIEHSGDYDGGHQDVEVESAQAFVRVTAPPGTPMVAYQVVVQGVRNLGPPPPPPPPPCDPRAWDPHNPKCKDECNFADPDLGDVRCCKLLSPCVHAPPDNGWLPCHARVTSIDGTRVRAAIGTADAGIAHLPAELLGDTSPPTLYDGRGNMITPTDGATPWLVFISADEHTSEWEFRTTRGHDMAWWQTHAQILEFRPPPVCR